jgi:hypothetical protein
MSTDSDAIDFDDPPTEVVDIPDLAEQSKIAGNQRLKKMYLN